MQWTVLGTVHRVTGFNVKKSIDPNSILFLEIPDAPLEIQVEPGPRQGTLLVMWLPVKPDGKPPNSIVNGYSVYVDGRKVKEMLSPTGTMPNLLIIVNAKSSSEIQYHNSGFSRTIKVFQEKDIRMLCSVLMGVKVSSIHTKNIHKKTKMHKKQKRTIMSPFVFTARCNNTAFTRAPVCSTSVYGCAIYNKLEAKKDGSSVS